MNYFSKKKKWVAYLILLTFVFTCIVPTNLGAGNMAYAEETSTIPVSSTINKTATPLDENDQTNVTLSVPGEAEVLGSDIIYIVGSYATDNEGNPNVEGDVLISSLVDTMKEMVAMGTHVNFGMVPFSSDNVVAMPLTRIDETNIDQLPTMIANALATCEAVYDGVNMENALVKSKKMFSKSELKDHPERQHLVMITSGFTYFFNSGTNNEYAATVPVNYTGVDRLFYWNKAWQRARTNQTNTYPIPKGIVEAYGTGTGEGLWDFYWSYINQWAKADIAAGDKVVYEACTIESGNFIKWYNSGELVNGYSQTGYGKAVPKANTTAEDIANAVTLTAGANPLEKDSNGEYTANAKAAAHALGYERAMWEAYEYSKANITGAGINFYPIYNALSPQYTNGVWSDGRVNENGKVYKYNISYTNQYIGHSFVDMLAGGEGRAVKYDKQGDKTFFAPIKDEILYYCSNGSTVEDYIGYDAEKGNFEFIQNADCITLTKNGEVYTTAQIAPKDGADSSYAFTAQGALEPTFWLDYYYGDGKTTEKFIWTFGEDVSKYVPVSLTYKLQLTEKAGVREGELVSIYDKVPTNNSAFLYPVDSAGNKGTPERFPDPEVFYIVQDETVNNAGSFAVYKKVTGDKAPAASNEYGFQLKMDARIEQWDVSLATEKLALENEIADAQVKADNAAGIVSEKEENFRENAVVFESSDYKLVMAEDPVPTTDSAYKYEYTIADVDGNVVNDVTTASAYMWEGKAESDGSFIEDVIDAIKELAKEFSSLFNRVTFMGALNDILNIESSTPSALGFHTGDAEALLFAERDRLAAEEEVAEKEAALDNFIKTEVTTPAAITVTLTPTAGSNLEAKVYELTPENYDAEDGYVIDFTLFKDTGYAVSVEATTGTMINYVVSELTGFYTEDYEDTDVDIGTDKATDENLVRNTGELKLTPDKVNTIRFTNNYANNPSGDGDSPYIPDWNPPDDDVDIPDRDVPKGDYTPEDEIIDDPEVPLGDMEIPGEPVNPDEELDEPEIPLGDAPATGDSANAVPFMALLLAAIIGLAITRRKFN
ncbi:MAG: hypothetical protein IKU46_00265 [Peptococcaceae bacterium]|nr:hypothetical protein [Peptococcaceae bacterium]